ncbi:hypothetical protein ADUPG1_002558, partial [Aduncisulcus paluster]
ERLSLLLSVLARVCTLLSVLSLLAVGTGLPELTRLAESLLTGLLAELTRIPKTAAGETRLLVLRILLSLTVGRLLPALLTLLRRI